MEIATLVQLCPAFGPYAVYVAAAVGIAAQIAALLPPPGPNVSTGYRLVYSAINWLGRNVRYATNASAPPKTGG